jgi:ATPase subunit of ABC transporter with duplicated ATPase domains
VNKAAYCFGKLLHRNVLLTDEPTNQLNVE